MSILKIGWNLEVRERERTENKDDYVSLLAKLIAIQCDLRALWTEFKTGKQYEKIVFFFYHDTRNNCLSSVNIET